MESLQRASWSCLLGVGGSSGRRITISRSCSGPQLARHFVSTLSARPLAPPLRSESPRPDGAFRARRGDSQHPRQCPTHLCRRPLGARSCQANAPDGTGRPRRPRGGLLRGPAPSLAAPVCRLRERANARAERPTRPIVYDCGGVLSATRVSCTRSRRSYTSYGDRARAQK